jgi:hypothetical protein
MMKSAVYAVEMGEKAEIFSESPTGAFDFEREVEVTETRTFARDALADDYPRTELAYPDDTYGSPLYRLDEEGAKPRVYRWARPEAGPVSAGVAGFFARYPAFAASLRAGDFGAAGRIVERSRKLAPFRSLLRYFAGEKAFFAFALYWLGEFDAEKEAALASLLSGKGPTGSRYGGVFDFAKGSISARSTSDFDEECKEKLRALLVDRKEPLVLPIIGTRFRPCIADLSSCIAAVKEEAFRRAIFEDKPEEETARRIRAYVDGIKVLLAPEPYNPSDPSAVLILLRFPDGSTAHAG